MKKKSVYAAMVCALFACMFTLFGCGDDKSKARPKVIEPKTIKLSGKAEISFRLVRRDSVWLIFHKSEYSGNVSYCLGADFLNFTQPDWWARVRTKLEQDQKDYLAHGIEPSFREIPPVDWMNENVERHVEVQYMVELALPTGGVLQRRVSPAEYEEFVKRYPLGESGYFEMDPRRIVLGDTGANIFSNWNMFESARRRGSYFAELSKIREALEGQLLFEYRDKEFYMVIQLPREFLAIKEADIPRGFTHEFTAQMEIYAVVHKWK